MSIDKQDIVDSYFEGEGEPFCMVAAPILFPDWYVPLEELPEDIQEIWGYNPEKARELLDEALGPGVEIDFDLISIADTMDQCVVLQSYWNDVGLNANLVAVEEGSYRNLVQDNEDYHGLAAHNGGLQEPYREAMLPHDFYPGVNFEDPIWEALQDEMQVTTDPDEQWTLYEQARNHFLRNVPIIRFPHPYVYAYWQPWLGGYHGEYSPGNYGVLWAHLWVDQTVKRAYGR